MASGNMKRYKKELLISYLVPLLFVLLTAIVEAAGPVCSSWKPRFVEEACFFGGKLYTIVEKKIQTLLKSYEVK